MDPRFSMVTACKKQIAPLAEPYDCTSTQNIFGRFLYKKHHYKIVHYGSFEPSRPCANPFHTNISLLTPAILKSRRLVDKRVSTRQLFKNTKYSCTEKYNCRVNLHIPWIVALPFFLLIVYFFFVNIPFIGYFHVIVACLV